MVTDHINLEDVINNVKLLQPAQHKDPRLDVFGVFVLKQPFALTLSPTF